MRYFRFCAMGDAHVLAALVSTGDVHVLPAVVPTVAGRRFKVLQEKTGRQHIPSRPRRRRRLLPGCRAAAGGPHEEKQPRGRRVRQNPPYRIRCGLASSLYSSSLSMIFTCAIALNPVVIQSGENNDFLHYYFEGRGGKEGNKNNRRLFSTEDVTYIDKREGSGGLGMGECRRRKVTQCDPCLFTDVKNILPSLLPLWG